MPAVAPDLVWQVWGGWKGRLPIWPFDRPQPAGLERYLAGRRFQVTVDYLQSFPMTPPRFLPVDPEPDIYVRSMAEWHVSPDGSLCLFQTAAAWDPFARAADLVPKAAGWFLEYMLLVDGRVDAMTEAGIAHDDSLDVLLDAPP